MSNISLKDNQLPFLNNYKNNEEQMKKNNPNYNHLRKYKYTLKEGFKTELHFIRVYPIFENEFGVINRNCNLIIHKGYSWNGCSAYVWQGKEIPEHKQYYYMPKITDDSDYYCETLAASLVHDYLCQFITQIMEVNRPKGFYGTRLAADKEFRKLCKEYGFSFSDLYYGAVRTEAFFRWTFNRPNK